MLRSSAVFNSLEENHFHEHRVSEPMVKALVRGLASLSACTVDLSGCQVARVEEEYKGLVFNLFLKYVLRLIQP